MRNQGIKSRKEREVDNEGGGIMFELLVGVPAKDWMSKNIYFFRNNDKMCVFTFKLEKLRWFLRIYSLLKNLLNIYFDYCC